MAEQQTQHGQTQVEDVHGSGVYPGSGPLPPGDAVVRSPAALGHPELRRETGRHPESFERFAHLVGRVIFGGYFLYNGVNHFKNHQAMTEYARHKGVPAPGLAVAGTGLLLIAGGLSMITGTRPKVGAALITTFLAGVSSQMHAFWREEDPQQRMSEMVNFTKNMALVASALLAAGHAGRWPWSVDSGLARFR